jgi:hypothetical protein
MRDPTATRQHSTRRESKELKACESKSIIEGTHAAHAAQPQLLHEASCVRGASDAEFLARGLAGGEHTTHGARDVDMHRRWGGRRDQFSEQLIERQVPVR